MSDLHADLAGFRGYPALVPGVDAVLVAGDVRQGIAAGLAELRRAYPHPTEIVVVAGNHEFWGGEWLREIELGRLAAGEHGVHFLECSDVVIRGVRIIGCTLWADYELFGADLRASAMRFAYAEVRDHKRIKWSSNPWRRFRPQEARTLHLRSRSFVENELARANCPMIVLTHFAGTTDAVPPEIRPHISTAAACSDLHEIVDRYQPHLWISGHTHYRMDIKRGRTRMISNPYGYPGERTGFDPDLTVEVGE